MNIEVKSETEAIYYGGCTILTAQPSEKLDPGRKFTRARISAGKNTEAEYCK